MIEHALLFTLGLVLLLLGADNFLKGASGLALRYGISPFIVGLVIVGLGTSAPELAVNLSAVARDRYDLALGNVVGSNIANVGLILGISAMVAPLVVQMRLVRVEGPLMVLVSGALWLLCLDGLLGGFDSFLLMAGFVGLMWLLWRSAREEPSEVQAELGELPCREVSLPKLILRLAIGLAILLLGADLMVDSAVALARAWGWSELLIGLTVVAIGTSLPELASSLVAAWRGQTDIAVGNVVGSNLFNILLILGVTSTIKPLPVSAAMFDVELPAMAGFAVLGYFLMQRFQRLSRVSGAVLFVLFVGFTAWQAWAAIV
ncbi:calcium/sodium antiporter [Pseudomarimonas salicorniae]|uniref:Calcium/sodium antiporter n=1 Tax=Pseudomarimonas salicorniae TaxID=2933270 RepID=A0ABT0GKZ6_9GAMM|nr:calcium/sodium antiporter [Lysobacter sp. CAU 1642]MCK7595093.1 calcium/sodium antiporter [Lysobacter sp. CAU 1642]